MEEYTEGEAFFCFFADEWRFIDVDKEKSEEDKKRDDVKEDFT
jgi:hypothetical protein